MKFTSVLSAALLAQSSFAHPGDSAEETAREVAARREYLANNKRSLAHCVEPLKARGNDVAMHKRRSAMVEQLRAKRSISQGTTPLYSSSDHLGWSADILNREALPEGSRRRGRFEHEPQV